MKFITDQWRAVLVFVALLCAAGYLSATSLPVSIFPSVDFPRIVVSLDNGVIPATQMLASVTTPVVQGLSGLPGVNNIKSVTSRGSAEVNLFFDWGTDMNGALQLVNGKMAQLVTGMPPTVSLKRVARLTFAVFPIMGYSITSTSMDSMALRELGEYTIKPQLMRLAGVASVKVDGGKVREFHVDLDPTRLTARGLSVAQVIAAIKAANVVDSPGLVADNHRLVLTLVSGQASNIDELSRTLVSYGNTTSSPVFLRDIATVSSGPAPLYTLVSSENGPAITLNVLRQPNANTVTVADEVHKELSSLNLPKDVKITPFYDQSLLVRDSILSVRDSIVIGLGLSALVLFCFLGDIGTTLVASVVIPVTVVSTFLFMSLFGLGLDLMTLGGVAASIGLVIDDAIVVVEAIYARISLGGDRAAAVTEALHEILFPILGSTLTPVVVFLPMTLLSGVTGNFFRALSLTMAVALVTSLFLALSFTPVLARGLIRPGKISEGGRVLGFFVRIYERVLEFALHFRYLMVLLALGLMAGAGWLYTILPSDFLPSFDESAFVLDYVGPPGADLAETDRMLTAVEAQLKTYPEIESYSRRTGLQLGGSLSEANTGDFLVKLKPGHKRATDDITAEMRAWVESHEPALKVEFAGILGDLIGDLTSSPAPIVIKLFGPDSKTLETASQQVATEIAKVDHVVDVKSGVVISGPAVTFQVDPIASGRFGMNASDINSAVTAAVDGEIASTIVQQNRLLNVRVGLPRSSLTGLTHLPIRSPNGALVRLDQLVRMEQDPGQTELMREGLRPILEVTARLEKGDLGSAIAAIKVQLKSLQLPPGVTLEYGGLYQQQQSSFRELLLVMGLAASLVFLVLLVEFKSFEHPIAILAGSILATGGALLALWLKGIGFNVISFLGTIMILGIVAKNGILMLDAVEAHQAEGQNLHTALAESGKRRFRPVLMTSLTAALGMLPLALALGSGAEMLQPLAVAVIGGLVCSLFSSLIITPCVFSILQQPLHLPPVPPQGGSPRYESGDKLDTPEKKGPADETN